VPVILPLLLLATAQQAPGPVAPEQQRYTHCVDLAKSDPQAAAAEADTWATKGGGGMLAKQCLGIAYSDQGKFDLAAGAFEDAAHAALQAHDAHAADFWAQAGNAWLAAGNAGRARAALDSALSTGTLIGVDHGEVLLDHARALVALGQMTLARADLDKALTEVPDDSLAWLLSATLARRMDDLPRAQKDITEAHNRVGDDPQVELETGNIAAEMHDEAGAKAAWTKAEAASPDSNTGRAAREALAQFGAVPTPPQPQGR
jgi:tetratricopeptide (TPR) repeat protein